MSEELDRLEIEKRRLECDKLRAEIAEVSVVWWQRPGYLGSVGPIVIAIVGFLSVWSTGFFDTQRATLKSEVAGLKTEEAALKARAAELNRANAEMQGRIDDAYIKLRVVTNDAQYALGHLRGLGPRISPDGRKRVEVSLNGMSPDTSKLIRDLLDRDQLAEHIVPITEKELKRLRASLQDVPASKWAVDLEPQIGQVPSLRAPDGRVYNPADRKFYANQDDLAASVRR
jgi:hypothetical protein